MRNNVALAQRVAPVVAVVAVVGVQRVEAISIQFFLFFSSLFYKNFTISLIGAIKHFVLFGFYFLYEYVIAVGTSAD